MYTQVNSSALMGIDGFKVRVEIDIHDGFPRFDIIGLPDSAVKEAAERVRATIRNMGIGFPMQRVTVNLAPADIRKVGASYDLAIAVGILQIIGVFDDVDLSDWVILGELSLNGEVKGVPGILPMMCSMKELGMRQFMIPLENYEEAKAVMDVMVQPVAHMEEVLLVLREGLCIEVDAKAIDGCEDTVKSQLDFNEIKGQRHVKRAIEIAVAGKHHTLMIGPPGSGKTMMAKRIPSIMPPLNYEEQLAISKIYSISGYLMNHQGLMKKRPFRSPHHTITEAALSGGGKNPMPGEISLAHHGVLFLDELPEFRKHVLEILRQPLEDAAIRLTRSAFSVTYPTDFMLVCSMNPCPCGHFPNIEKCQCSFNEIRHYLGRVSGPLLDRIDLHIEAQSVDYEALASKEVTENSKTIRDRIMLAQERQYHRNKEYGVVLNSELPHGLIEEVCQLEIQVKQLLKEAFLKMELSARAYHRILKVARTIADLEGHDKVKEVHIAEAIQYRSLDKKYWGRG